MRKAISVTMTSVEDIEKLNYGVIYETTDYEVFKEFCGNRRDAEKRKNGTRFSILFEDLKSNGQKRPASVTSNLAVFKGQNRLAAAEKAKKPFKFIMYDVTNTEAMEEIRESWTESSGTALDYTYLNSIDPTKDKRGYKKILTLVDTYKIPMSYVPQIVSVVDGVSISPDTYEYRFVEQEDFNLDKVIKDAEELIQVLRLRKFTSQRALVNTFGFIYKNKGANEAKRVFSKVRSRAAKLTKNKVETTATLAKISEYANIDYLPATLQNK
jgi:hypothetical protein